MDQGGKEINVKSIKDEIMENVKSWHQKLCDNKGACARLRRCESPEKVMMQRETHILLDKLPGFISPEAVATISGILSHVKVGGEGKLGERLGIKKNDKVLFSETRFRNLLACKEWNEFYTALRRAVVVLDGNVAPESIIDVVRLWDEDKKGNLKEPTRKLSFILSREYYSKN